MNKREIIIVLAAALVAIYGALDYFVFSDKLVSQAARDAIESENRAHEFSAAALARIQKVRSIAEAEDLPYFLKKIEAPWHMDPFRQPVSAASDEKQTSRTVGNRLPPLVYSGFLMAGDRRMAIINGMEYMTGDILPETGTWKIADITPESVTIISKTQRRISLAIEEN